MSDFSRRRFVYGTGAAIAAGALAGCSDGGGNGDGNGTNGDGNGTNGDGNGTNGDGNGGNGGSKVKDHLNEQEANEWNDELEDHTGEDEVTVEVGGGDGLAFVPPGITVDSGTTIVWEWTGQGGGHNVSSVDNSDFDFQTEVTEEEGFTHEETFDESGAALYVCEPHRAQGMAGGIQVQ